MRVPYLTQRAYAVKCVCACVRALLTLGAEAGTGREARHVHDLGGKLLARVPVDAAPHHAEGTPTERERSNY